MLAEKTPSSFVAFDALAFGDESLVDQPFSVRRARLERELGGLTGPTYFTRTTTDTDGAQSWFEQFKGAGLDGVVAKPLGAPYQQNARPCEDQTSGLPTSCSLAPAEQDLDARAAAVGSLLLGL